jgi:hypothetical protein
MTPEITLKYLDEQIALIGTDAAPETIKDTSLMTAEVIEEQRLLDELAKTLPQVPNVLYEPLRKKGQRRVNHYYYRPAPNSPDYKWLVGGPEVLEEVQKNSKPVSKKPSFPSSSLRSSSFYFSCPF